VCPRNHVFDGGSDPRGKGHFWGGMCRPTNVSTACECACPVHAANECIRIRDGWQDGDAAACQITLDTGCRSTSYLQTGIHCWSRFRHTVRQSSISLPRSRLIPAVLTCLVVASGWSRSDRMVRLRSGRSSLAKILCQSVVSSYIPSHCSYFFKYVPNPSNYLSLPAVYRFPVLIGCLLLLLHPDMGAKYCDQRVCLSACLFVCYSVHSHIWKTTCQNFMKFSTLVTCGRGSFFLWWQCDTLC